MRILFVGDIFGKPGREIARRAIPALIERESLDFVIANVENSAAGFGVTGDIADTILSYGVDAMTTRNHVWDKKEILDYVPRQPKLLRPANFPPGTPGRGSYVGRTRSGEAMAWSTSWDGSSCSRWTIPSPSWSRRSTPSAPGRG